MSISTTASISASLNTPTPIPPIPTADFISYREEGSNYSKFLDINKLLNSSRNKIHSVYESILFSVNSFESNKIDKLIELEGRLYNKLKEKNDGYITQIIKTIFSLCIYQIIKYFKNKNIDNTHASYQHYFSNIKKSLEPKKNEAPLKEITELNEARLQDPEKELERLMKIDRIRKSLEKTESYVGKSLRHKLAYAHSLELREKIKDRYYVINHGQNPIMMALNILARKLKQIYEPDQYKNFQVLRHDIFFPKDKDQEKVEWYQNVLKDALSNSWYDKTKTDHNYRELISGDCCLESVSKWESAVDFFTGRASVMLCSAKYSHLNKISEKILSNYFPEPHTKQFSDEMLEICKGFDLPTDGTLYSICIPKNQFEKVGYLSWEFGQPNYLFHKTDIETFQNGEIPGGAAGLPDRLQVRLLSHMLKPENGVLIVENSTIDQSKIIELEEKIGLLIQKAQLQFRIK